MTRTPILFVASLAASAALAAGTASADGGYVSPEGQDLYEPTQLGLIVHDAQSAREDLYLQVDFYEASGGSVARMGWILALPAVPEVDAAGEGLFVELMNMTRPYENDDDFSEGCAGTSEASGNLGGGRTSAVDVESRQVVGAFDVTTVASDSAAPLAAWIAERGFTAKDGTEEILQFYIDKGWHFVAIDVDLAEALTDGYLPPVKLSFDAAQPVFPLRISAINGLGMPGAEDGDDYYGLENTGVLLYAVSSRPLTLAEAGIEPEFVNALDGADLSEYPTLDAALPGSGYIVKLRVDKTASEMTDDLYLVPLSQGAAMAVPRRGGFDLAWLAVILMMGGGAAKRLRRRERSRG